MNVATNSTALYHSTLFYTLAYLNMTHKYGSQLRALFHKIQAIRAMNEGLAHEEKATSDEMIASMLIMFNFDVSMKST